MKNSIINLFFVLIICVFTQNCANTKYSKLNHEKYKFSSKKQENRYFLKNDKYPDKFKVPNLDKIKEPIPKYEPKSKYGNPKNYTVKNKKYHVLDTSKGYKEKGLASWYGVKFHGFRTSSGEPYDMYEMTAAHKTLPLPCYVKVTNLENKRQIIVRVIDRGPFAHDRVIDLSYAAAYRLGILKKGTAKVVVEAIEPKKFRNKNIKNLEKLENNQDNLGNKKVTPNQSDDYLQLAAFTNESNAKNFIEQIKNSKNTDLLNQQQLVIYKDNINNNTLYKVQLGPIKNATNIENNYDKSIKDNGIIKILKNKLSELNINSHLVTR